MRFSGFDDEWKSYRIGDISKTYSGGTPSTSKKVYYYGNIPFIKSGEINKSCTEQYINEDAINNSSAKKVKKGDLLLALYGATSGEVAISKIDGAINQAVLKIDNNMDNYFQYNYFLKYKEKIIHKYLQGGQGNLSANIIKKLEFKFPKMEEQQKISRFLLLIDEKIQLLKKKHKEYQNFKKYLMQQIFTQKLRFDDNCQYKTKQVKDFLIESKIEGIDDINKRLTVKLNLKGITVRESKTIEIEGATKQFIRKTGQFIYGKQNLHKGAFGIIPKELDGYLTSSDIPSFDFKGGIEPKWFYYYFARKSFYEKLENLSTGTGSKRISPKEFLNIKIIVPEFKEQHKIVCLLEKFDEKINGISNQIVQMNMFKKSLLQQMFVVRINWRCNFKLAKSPSFNKHLLILKNKIIFIIIK